MVHRKDIPLFAVNEDNVHRCKCHNTPPDLEEAVGDFGEDGSHWQVMWTSCVACLGWIKWIRTFPSIEK